MRGFFETIKTKVIIVLIALILFHFAYPKQVQAKSFLESAGGTLLEPICDFLVFGGDTILNTLQKNFLVDQDILIQASNDEHKGGIVGGIVAITGGVLLMVVGLIAIGASAGFAAPLATAAEQIGITTIAGGVAALGIGGTVTYFGATKLQENLSGEFDLPVIAYTPYAIFSNIIPIFDINFFSPNRNKNVEVETGQGEEIMSYVSESSADILAPTVSSWYKSIRDLVIVCLLSVLLFIGIRILLASASEAKAKYKQMLTNWLVAICILAFMHYIMVFIVNMSQIFSDMVSTKFSETILVPLPKDTKVGGEKLPEDENLGYPIWATNLTGYARISAGSKEPMEALSFTIIYLVIVIYTIIFTFIYLRRVLYMAFLTMIAPFVALTYPIEKVNGGQSVAFNMWIKEYSYNALLQPFHMILYTVVVGSVIPLAEKHPVYAVVALGFLIPAEKLLKKMFGFNKAETIGDAGNVSSAMMSGMNRFMHWNHMKHRTNSPRQEFTKTNGEVTQKKPTIRLQDTKDLLNNYAEDNNIIDQYGKKDSQNKNEINNNQMADANTRIQEQGERNQETKMPETTRSDNDTEPLQNNGTTTQTKVRYHDNKFEAMNQNEDTNTVLNQPINADLAPYQDLFKKPKLNKSIQPRKYQHMVPREEKGTKKFTGKIPTQKIVRNLAGMAGGVTLGMAGLATGIATGKPSEALNYTKQGLEKGKRITTKGIDAVANKIAIDQPRQKGNTIRKSMTPQKIQKFQNNKKNQEFVKSHYQNDQEIMKKVVPEYLENGITDIKDICAGYELEKEGMNRTSAISVVKLSETMGDIRGDEYKQQAVAERIEKELGETTSVQKQYNIIGKQLKQQYKKQQRALEQQNIKNRMQHTNSMLTKKNEQLDNLKTNIPRYYSSIIIQDMNRFQDKKDALSRGDKL